MNSIKQLLDISVFNHNHIPFKITIKSGKSGKIFSRSNRRKFRSGREKVSNISILWFSNLSKQNIGNSLKNLYDDKMCIFPFHIWTSNSWSFWVIFIAFLSIFICICIHFLASNSIPFLFRTVIGREKQTIEETKQNSQWC